MTKKLEIRPSGEVGFVDGYMMAIVYPVAECPQSTAERDFNVARMVDSWNNYDALQSLNAELLEFAGEWLAAQGSDENYMTEKARAAIAKARNQ